MANATLEAPRSRKVKPEVEQFIRETISNPSRGTAFIEQTRQALRKRCKDNPLFFIVKVLKYVDASSPLHQDMIRRWVKRRSRRYTLWLIPRSHLKTSVWTVGMNMWEVINDPSLRFLIINAVYTKALEILAEIKSHFDTNEVLRWLFPEFCPDLITDRRRAKLCNWTSERLDFPCGTRVGKKEGNFECLGVEMSLVSKHYDVMVFDDAVNDKNTATTEYLEKVWSWFRNSLQLRHDPNQSRIILIGTRWHFDDIYGRVIEQEHRRRLLGQAPRWLVYRRKVIEKNPDGIEVPIWPERFTLETIKELEEENGSYIFAHQYLNEPISADDALFKRDKIQFVDEFEVPLDVYTYAAVDLVEEGEYGSDSAVITVMSFDNLGNYYVRQIMRGRIMPFDVIEIIRTLTQVWDIQAVAIEDHGFQRSIVKFYRHYAEQQGFSIPWRPVKIGTQSKFRRILALQPVVETDRFHIVEGIQNAEILVGELTQVTLSHMPTHDDVIDTVALLHAIHQNAPVIATETKPPPNSLDALFPLDEDIRDLTLDDSESTFIGSTWRASA